MMYCHSNISLLPTYLSFDLIFRCSLCYVLMFLSLIHNETCENFLINRNGNIIYCFRIVVVCFTCLFLLRITNTFVVVLFCLVTIPMPMPECFLRVVFGWFTVARLLRSRSECVAGCGALCSQNLHESRFCNRLRWLRSLANRPG